MSTDKKVSTLRIVILICSFIAYLTLFYFTPDLETNNWFLKGFIFFALGFWLCVFISAFFVFTKHYRNK